jgi:sugar phosphate isomerase/epimerase
MSAPYIDRSEYAVSSWTFAAAGLHEALEAIARRGFNATELWGDTVHFDPRAGLDRRSIKKWLGDLGLTVHSVHGPFRNFGGFSPGEEFRKYRQRLWRETIDDCSEFEVPIMVVHGLDRQEYNYTTAEIQIVRDSLGELREYGAGRGVMIALENLPGSGGNPNEIRCRLEDHVKNYGGLGLKYCLDIGHAVLNGADLFKEIDAAGKDLVTFHIHNNDGRGDSHDLPDRGIIDWPAVHAYIRGKGYTGRFVLEIFGGTDPFPVMDKIDALFSKSPREMPP